MRDEMYDCYKDFKFSLEFLKFFLFQADPNQLEAKLSNGLICGHAYSITACKYVSRTSLNSLFNLLRHPLVV